MRRYRIEIPSGDVVLRGERSGNPADPIVVLLHGGGQTRHSWAKTALDLSRKGFQVVNLDLRGHGDSGWAPDGDYSVDAFADDVASVLRWVAQPAALVGASMGGLASLVAVGERDGLPVDALVLVDVAPRVEMLGVQRITEFMGAAPDGFASLDEAADAIAAYRGGSAVRPVDPAGLRKNLRLGADGRWRWHWDPQFLRGDRTPRASRDPVRLEAAAARLRVPTLLVRGRASDMVSEESVRHFRTLAPHAEFVDVSGAGHMVVADRNEVFGSAVEDFLSRTVASAVGESTA